MDFHERNTLASRAYAAALRGDDDKAADALERIHAHSSPVQMFSACCAFASDGAAALRKMQADAGLPPGPVHAKPQPDNTDTPARRCARWFIVAFTNHDPAMLKAVFMAALTATGDGFEQFLAAVLLEAADMHRAVCPSHPR